jgi:hypothetical protein
MATMATMATATADTQRDRYTEAASDLAEHIGDKVLVLLRSPDNQARIQSVLDPIISHIINRIFPYILLSAILFLILFILTIGTFYMVMRTSGGFGVVTTTSG